jgi:hypothetical protein
MKPVSMAILENAGVLKANPSIGTSKHNTLFLRALRIQVERPCMKFRMDQSLLRYCVASRQRVDVDWW